MSRPLASAQPRQPARGASQRPGTLYPQRDRVPVRPPLPAAPTPLLGRAAEVDQLRALLWDPETRLVTLTGPGGVGKTRLALAAAEMLVEHYADGVQFIDLSSISDPALVPGAVAAALDVQEANDRPLAGALLALLRDQDLLLVLDNCEQVAGAATHFAAWLVHAPALVILATSRAALHIRSERIFPVEPLALPAVDQLDPAALAQTPAAALFIARARAVLPSFALTAENAPAVAALCRRLDGLPLAIELVALHTRLFSPQALLTRLNEQRSLPPATWHDLPARQRTLTDTIAWSHELLTPAEQATFRRLASFVGGWTLEAAETVCGGDAAVPDPVATLLALVDQSLVRPVATDDEPRFAMLETIREFATAQLAASGEADATAQRHADYFQRYAERNTTASSEDGQVRWYSRLEADIENLRAALRWHAARQQAESGLRLAITLGNFWTSHGRLREGYHWLTEAFADRQTDVSPLLRGQTQRLASTLAFSLGNYAESIDHAAAALRFFQTTGTAADRSAANTSIGLSQRMLGHLDEARGAFLETLTLARDSGMMQEVGIALTNLGGIAFDRGDFASAAAYYNETLGMQRQIGSEYLRTTTLTNLAIARIMQGDYQVRDLFDESLTLSAVLRVHTILALTVAALALLAQIEGQFARSVRLLGGAAMVRDIDGLPIPPPERPYHERMGLAARQALGETTFATCWATGHGWSLEELLDYARLRAEPDAIPDATATPPASPAAPPGPTIALTRREREVLTLLVASHTNHQIADTLSISSRTVETHVANIIDKLGAANRVQAVTQTLALGLLK